MTEGAVKGIGRFLDLGAFARPIVYCAEGYKMEQPALDRHQWMADHVLVWEPDVRRWLHRCARALSEDDIDDLMQEAYARIWRLNFSIVRDGRTLLFATGSDVLKDQFRRARVVSIDSGEELELLDSEAAPAAQQWLSARDQYENLQQAVMRLAPQRRAVFEAHKFDGLPLGAIAKRLGISHRTVERDMTFALHDVMKMMLAD
jgi:RNA polymerase sigma-70 factor (ECF subfamily)